MLTLVARVWVNILTDFLLSVSPKYSTMADFRVRDAVDTLLKAKALKHKVFL